MEHQHEPHRNDWPAQLFRASNNGESWRELTGGGAQALRVMAGSNCITFPSIKLRLKWDTAESENNNIRTDATIIRRHECLSVSLTATNQTPRHLVVKFRCETDCLAFCTRLESVNGHDESDADESESFLDDPEETIQDISRLLLSAYFMEFVDNVDWILQFPEGQQLLESLVNPRGDYESSDEEND